jgi:signal transduction histidine kinase
MGEIKLHQLPGRPVASLSPSADDALPLAVKAKTLARAQKALAADDTASPGTDSQKQLNEYREKLARDLERRELTAKGLSPVMAEKARVSPIPEESTSGSPTLISALTTTSTESGNTIRGGMTPAAVASTPSYPFPRMASGGLAHLQHTHRPFTTLSPTGAPPFSQAIPFEPAGVHDTVLSGNSTPASNLTFQPAGIPAEPENPDFPNPNLYELSLMLAGEPGLDAWWGTVVQIMKDVYKAERVTLAVPADTTDIENVPWGQKATYNEHSEDDLSLGYMARGSSAMRSSEVEASEGSTHTDEAPKPATPLRPGLMSRHSYTSYEENKEKAHEKATNLLRRPNQLSRSRSYFPSGQASTEASHKQAPLNKTALDQHDAAEQQQTIPSWEAPFTSPRPGQGRVLPVLQALDYEADPLIDHAGVMRVLDRGRIVALTRTYPYLNSNSPLEQHANSKAPSKPTSTDTSKRTKRTRSESMSKLSNIFAGSTGRGKSSNDKSKGTIFRLEEEIPRPPTPKYEEYEQALPSPWSQSPAPSPAVRAEPKENPFFTDAMVDEESFNPDSAPTDYTSIRPPEAIGVDNSWTVLHIPLTHVLLSKPANQFRLDNTIMQQKSNARNKDDAAAAAGSKEVPEHGSHAPDSTKKSKMAPIAILSVLSPIIPYPSNLRHSLEHLAPHLATTFSLCRHYTHLETELAGLQRRRPTTTGFGAVAPDGRPIDNTPYLLAADITRQQSFPGSMTSPSDYSAISKSATGSPSGTPGWDTGSLGYMMDRRQPTASPAALPQTGESYFSSKQRAASARHDVSGLASQKSRPASKDSSPSDKKASSRPSSIRVAHDASDNEDTVDKTGWTSEDFVNQTGNNDGQGLSGQGTHESIAERSAEKTLETAKSEQAHSRHGHTLLHSYGADFASTFQSLPPSSTLISRPPLAPAPSRSGSIPTTAVDMPPPSDKLKGLMLDLLPAHVFVALPQTGEIVWVNSRYLSYRGQTVADLAVDPWGSIHLDDREEYLKAWSHSLRTGEQFSRTVRIKRFDGAYRWFYARAVASKDKRGVIMQFLGSYMDIHDQHIAELKAARQEEIEASEAKHRLLANLIPQIIFTATEDDGITFANEQWLSYTGQSFEDSLGLGFLDFVHPEDLAKCRIPTDHPPTPSGRKRDMEKKSYQGSVSSEATSASTVQPTRSPFSLDHNLRGMHQALSRNNSSSSDEVYELPTADLSELARKGVIKVATDANGRLSYTTEVRLRSKTGEYRWHLIRCVEIDTIDFGSGASSYFGSATDINDHKILETKLKEAMESKSRFLSNMSHEIRTPLIGISGMVSFLQDTPLNEEQRDYTNTIQTSANSLIMIINDILDLSKVDAGMMKLKYEWFHTRSLIEDVNELVSTMAIAKRLELNYLVEADVPAWVKGDKVRIRQVLLNVIGNAIKFTSEGEVFSRCKVYTGSNLSCGKNEIILEFAIVDTGRGFSKEEAELIFKPFSQIDGSSTRQHGGSGLGLVISRQLVELHGGKMEGTAVPRHLPSLLGLRYLHPRIALHCRTISLLLWHHLSDRTSPKLHRLTPRHCQHQFETTRQMCLAPVVLVYLSIPQK